MSRCRMSQYRRQILELLAERSGKTGACAMSKQDIACEISCSLKTVDRAVSFLKSDGYIAVEPRFDETGAQTGNSYRVVSMGGRAVMSDDVA